MASAITLLEWNAAGIRFGTMSFRFARRYNRILLLPKPPVFTITGCGESAGWGRNPALLLSAIVTVQITAAVVNLYDYEGHAGEATVLDMSWRGCIPVELCRGRYRYGLSTGDLTT